MATAVAELQTKVTADTSQAEKSFAGLNTSFGKLSLAFGVGALAATAVAKATGFVTDALKGSIAAAQSEQVSQVKVNAILKTLKGSLEDHTKAIDKASAAAVNLGFDDEDAAESMAKLLQVTGDTTKANQAFELSMDLARFKGIALTDAQQAITMALNGNTRVLKQLGIDIPDNATKMELLGLVHEKVAGQAAAFGDTAAGAQEKFKVAMENVQEKLGGIVLPVITTFFNTVAGFLSSEKFTKWLDALKTGFDKFTKDATTVYVPLIRDTLGGAFADASAAVNELMGSGTSGLAGITGQFTAIDIIIAPLVGLMTAFGVAVKVASGFMLGMKSAAEGIANALIAVFDAIKRVSDASAGGFVSGVLKTGNSIKDLFRAEGGAVTAGQPYIVGEKRPELFVPNSNGTIIPKVPTGAGGGVNISFSNFSVTGQRDLDQIIAAVKSVTARELKLAGMGV